MENRVYKEGEKIDWVKELSKLKHVKKGEHVKCHVCGCFPAPYKNENKNLCAAHNGIES